ncbi:ABC transporter ATP-binding protein [Candidatus Woesearchaeota archaeon]|nr:ABC transporter ATP-binding protein [Candidatus Woesearchaeota archaeon]
MSLVEFRNVSHYFRKKVVLQDVDLRIEHHQILGIVGRSGAGKTTLFRLLLGIYLPYSGSVLLNGKTLRQKIKQSIGFASQENSFYESLSVEENLRYFGAMYSLSRKSIEERIDYLLKFMQLQEARKTLAKNLSGGMKRRLDLALALIHDPELLILDEPTTGLDIFLNEHIWDFILKIHQLGKTIIISSHNLEEIEKYCTHVAFLAYGKVITAGSLKIIQKRYHLEELFRKISYAENL